MDFTTGLTMESAFLSANKHRDDGSRSTAGCDTAIVNLNHDRPADGLSHPDKLPQSNCLHSIR